MTDKDWQRFWAKVQVNFDTGCWLWVGSLDDNGYGHFVRGRDTLAHRVAWKWFVGDIPARHVVDHVRLNYAATRHTCSTSCVNPEHLRVVSQYENVVASERHRAASKISGRQLGLRKRKHDMPEGLSPHTSGYQVHRYGKYVGVRKTLEAAVAAWRDAQR